MTKREAAIVSAYTGFLLGDFGGMHEYVEGLLGYPVFTHQFADKEFAEYLHEASKTDFISICVED
jgi:hypothetical protein